MSTITKPSQRERNFIRAAPDARPSKRKPPASTQITLTVADDLLARVDDFARQTGQSRSGLFKAGVNRILRDGI